MSDTECGERGRPHRIWQADERQRGADCGRSTITRQPTGPMPDFLALSVQDGGTFWIELYGELDLATAPTLVHELQAARESAADRVVIDLSGLEFMDSSGLHVLITARADAAAGGYELTLTRGSRTVQRLFAVAGCTELFSFLD